MKSKQDNENVKENVGLKPNLKFLAKAVKPKLRIYFLLFVILFISIISSSCTNLVSGISDKGRWIVVKDTMDKPRFPATANLLPDGNVLIMGGEDQSADTAEIFDPNQMKIIKSIPLDDKRYCGYSATTLKNGDVFVAGGYSFINMQGQKITNTTKIFDSKTYEFKQSKPLDRPMYGDNSVLLNNGHVLMLPSYEMKIDTHLIYNPYKDVYYKAESNIKPFEKKIFKLKNGNIIFRYFGKFKNNEDKTSLAMCLYNYKENKFEPYDDIPYEHLLIQLDDENYLTIKPELTYSSGYTYNINTKEKIPVKNNINRTWRGSTFARPVPILLRNGNVLILGILAKEKSKKYINLDKYSAYIYDRKRNKFYEIPAPPYPVYGAGIVMLQNGDILLAGGGYRIRPKQIGAISSNKIQIFKYNK